MTTWSEDWNVFAREVAKLIRDGATTERLSELFGGKTVRWAGTVDEVDLDELAPGVDLDMPEELVHLGQGRSVSIGGLHLPVATEAIPDWTTVEPGDHVRFEATLGAGNAPFPPVEVQTLNSGKTILMICVTKGKLIERYRGA